MQTKLSLFFSSSYVGKGGKRNKKHRVPVEDQCAEGFAVHVFGHDDQRLAVLVGDFQGRHDALHAGDLLLTQEQVGVLELTFLP